MSVPTERPPVVHVPDEMACNFPDDLFNKPLYFVGYVHKVNERQTRQLRIVVLSHDMLYLCNPLGDVARCMPLASIEGIHLAGAEDVALYIPSEYDLHLLTPQAPAFVDIFVQLRATTHLPMPGQREVASDDPPPPPLDVRRSLNSEDLKQGRLSKPDNFVPNIPPPMKNVCSESSDGVPTYEVLEFTFTARKIDKKDRFGKSDPFLEIHRPPRNAGVAPLGGTPAALAKWPLLYKSEVLPKTLNPDWRPFQLTVQQMRGGKAVPTEGVPDIVHVDVWDHDKLSPPDFIGSCEVNIQEIFNAVDTSGPGTEIELPLINAKKRERKLAKGKKYENSGTLHIVAGRKAKKRLTIRLSNPSQAGLSTH